MSPFVTFCLDFGKRYQVTCRVAFLGLVCVLNFSAPSIERLLEQLRSAVVSLARMATPADGNVSNDGPQERGIWHHKFCCYIL